jgi:predicted RNase H-like HicB family nuclease
MQTYLVVIAKVPTGYAAHCPEVSGCAAVGRTIDKVRANMQQAIEFHFEGMVEDGAPIPPPRGADTYQEVMKDLDVEHDLLMHVQIDISRFRAPIA